MSNKLKKIIFNIFPASISGTDVLFKIQSYIESIFKKSVYFTLREVDRTNIYNAVFKILEKSTNYIINFGVLTGSVLSRNVLFKIQSVTRSAFFTLKENIEISNIYNTVFKIMEGSARIVRFNVVSSIYNTVFKIVERSAHIVNFNILTGSLYSTMFLIKTRLSVLTATFSVREDVIISRRVLFTLLEGDDDEKEGDCISLNC